MPSYTAQRSLELMSHEQARLCERLVALTDAELQSASNLPGWSIADLLVHTTRVCDSLRLAVKRSLVGDTTPVFGPASGAREAEIRALGPDGWAALQRSAHAELMQVVAGLSPEQIEQSTFPFGPSERNIAWFCTQNLAEVAFHRWDQDRSLGAAEPFADDLAAYLLPFLLDAQRLLFWRKRTDGEPQTFALSIGVQTWVLRVSSDGTTVEPPGTSAQVTIAARPGWLALAAYGRVRTTGPAFTVTGPPDASDRFSAIFGPQS
jgi:uncharacterized protein (TIGR03083 family)